MIRKYREPTAKNLLREPLVFGVPQPAMLGLTLATLGAQVPAASFEHGNAALAALSGLTYGSLRLANRFAKRGWIEPGLYKIENLGKKHKDDPIEETSSKLDISPLTIEAPELLDEVQMISAKRHLLEKVQRLGPGERFAFIVWNSETGAVGNQYKFKDAATRGEYIFLKNRIFPYKYFYSLHQLPSHTDPLWLIQALREIPGNYQVIVSIKGSDTQKIKERIEAARRRNARTAALSNVDADVAFDESSLVLDGLARGEDTVVELSLLVISTEPAKLDRRYFCEERNQTLCLDSALGGRPRLFRSHYVRAVTASDLIPNLLDPEELGSRAVLKSVHGKTLYLDPLDSRLEALHWLVVGTTGTGKSFYTGLMLRRLIQQRAPISVLFIDHNRSYRRMVRATAPNCYLEPAIIQELKTGFPTLLTEHLGSELRMAGVELSDLSIAEKQEAIGYLLHTFEAFLRKRRTTHPIYLVLDECWDLLRNEPLLVQRAFREFRKLNGAAVAITQSLADFLTHETGRSIFQNASVRVLLRQGEDLAPYRGVLGINDVELDRLRFLRQERGVFSEVLIKTPFSSKLGRLYPTEEEHSLLRTDNIRAELIAEHFSKLSPNAEATS